MSYQEEITKDKPICYLLVQYLDLVKETILCIKNIRFCLRKISHRSNGISRGETGSRWDKELIKYFTRSAFNYWSGVVLAYVKEIYTQSFLVFRLEDQGWL